MHGICRAAGTDDRREPDAYGRDYAERTAARRRQLDVREGDARALTRERNGRGGKVRFEYAPVRGYARAILIAAIVQFDARELIGTLVRLMVAGIGSALGKYPVGNTGRVGINQPMPVPPELQAILAGLARQ